MGLPNKDEAKGTAEKAKGAVKESVGRAVGDEEMESEGRADRARGDVRGKYGEARRKVGDAVKDMGEAIRK